MNDLISIAVEIAILLALGGAIGLSRPSAFSLRWLLVAAALVLLNDAMLSRVYGLVPKLAPGLHWNWQGKLMALAATLAIAALPAFGWRRCGLTLRQAPGSVRPALIVAAFYAAWFIGLALVFTRSPPTPENLAFQATMPGLEEEPFYRGVLLFALDRAFTGRVRWLGVDWGWGAALSSIVFGLAHGLSFADGAIGFDALNFLLTSVPAVLGVWLRLRTGSLVAPILLHNFGNTIGLVIGHR